MNKPLTQAILSALYMLFILGCSNVSTPQKQANIPKAAYDIDYNADTHLLSIQSINVTPPHSNENISGLAGIFQPLGAVITGNLITVTAYITNNDVNPWTGVEVQAYQLLSGNSVTVYNPDFGTGWYVDSPAYGAWGWLFTSGTQGSEFTIPVGGSSANTVNGFYADSDFKARVYIYANVPVISSINQSGALVGEEVTISGYNFGTTPDQVTFNGTTANVVNWTANSIVATIPNITGQAEAITGNLIVNTGDLNTPYSNPIALTSYTYATYPVGTSPDGIAIDKSGNVWVTNDGDNTISELSSSGSAIGTYPVGNAPDGIAIDASGNVWVVNYSDNTITKLLGLTKGPQYFPYTGPQFPGGGNF